MISLELTWSHNCVISNTSEDSKYEINQAKQCVPVTSM